MYRPLFVVLLSLFALAAIAAADTAPLTLTSEERAWLQEHPTITVSGPQAFPPFQYVDENGSLVGMASDYINLLAEMAGIRVAYVSGIPWNEILEKVENKEIDVLACAAPSPDREAFLQFTMPHISFPLVIVSRKDTSFISGIESLHNKRVAFVKNTIVRQWLENENIHFVPHEASSPLDALNAVALGDADVVIDNLAAATYMIEKNGLVNLKIAAPTGFKNYALSIAVRKDWPELTTILNKALAAVAPADKDAIKQQWIMAIRYEHGIRSVDVFRWIALLAGAALVGLLLFYLWTRRLKKEIAERVRAEQAKERVIRELQQALEEVKTLRGILPICSQCKKIRDDKGYWTQLEEYIGRHSNADFSHGICPECLENLYGREKWYAQARDEFSESPQ